MGRTLLKVLIAWDRTVSLSTLHSARGALARLHLLTAKHRCYVPVVRVFPVF